MRNAGMWLVAVVVGFAGLAGLPGAGVDVAAAEAPARGSVVVPLVGPGGRPAFCGANHSGGRARPRAEGGYQVVGLAPGRHVVHLELTDERVDVLVTVAEGEEVVVPPVIVRGPCRDLSLRAPLPLFTPRAELPGWTLRIGRRYQRRPGTATALFARDRGLLGLVGATPPRRGPFTSGL
jgi:hypothetical protein